jgi:protein tyrosine/serine phosphatase
MATQTIIMQASTTNTPVTAAKPQRKYVSGVLALVTFILFAHAPRLQAAHEPDISTPPHDYGALPNFHAVHTYLYRGGEPTERGLAQLKQMGVSTVIDLRRSKQNIALERIQAEQLGLKYISLPMGNFIPSTNKQAQFFAAVTSASQHPESGRVFLHCSHGSDRTGFMVALWRVQHDGWSIADAAWEMVNSGFIVHKFRKDDRGGQLFD